MLASHLTERKQFQRTVIGVAVGLFASCSALAAPVAARFSAGKISSSCVDIRTSMARRARFHKSALCTVSTEPGLVFGLLWGWIAHGAVLTAADVFRWCLVRHGIHR
jgi:hypothetical protein